MELTVVTEPRGKSLYLGVSKHQVLSVGLQTMIQTWVPRSADIPDDPYVDVVITIDSLP